MLITMPHAPSVNLKQKQGIGSSMVMNTGSGKNSPARSSGCTLFLVVGRQFCGK